MLSRTSVLPAPTCLRLRVRTALRSLPLQKGRLPLGCSTPLSHPRVHGLRLGLPRYGKALGRGLVQLPPTTQSPCLFPGVQGKRQKTRVLGPKSQNPRGREQGNARPRSMRRENCLQKTAATLVPPLTSIPLPARKKGKRGLGEPEAGEAGGRARAGRVTGRAGWLSANRPGASACSTKLPSWPGSRDWGERPDRLRSSHLSLGGRLPTLPAKARCGRAVPGPSTLTVSLLGFLLTREAGCDFDFLKGHCQDKNHTFYNHHPLNGAGLVGRASGLLSSRHQATLRFTGPSGPHAARARMWALGSLPTHLATQLALSEQQGVGPARPQHHPPTA